MSARPADKQQAAGNLVTAISLPIRSDIADPLERLIAVSKESVEAKKLTYAMGPHLAADAAEFLPSTLSGQIARRFADFGLVERVPPIVNTVITNVPGPIVHGLGLFQPVLSYNDTITISAVADRSTMPDPSFYGECLQRAFDELKMATIEKTTKPKKSKTSNVKNIKRAAGSKA